MNTQDEINLLKQTIINLENELQQTKEHLKKYTAPASNKIYYEKHKDEIKDRNYKKNSPEKRVEYNKRAYQKRKEKQKLMEENI